MWQPCFFFFKFKSNIHLLNNQIFCFISFLSHCHLFPSHCSSFFVYEFIIFHPLFFDIFIHKSILYLLYNISYYIHITSKYILWPFVVTLFYVKGSLVTSCLWHSFIQFFYIRLNVHSTFLLLYEYAASICNQILFGYIITF